MYEVDEFINDDSNNIDQILFENRFIPIFGYIDEDMARKVISKLKAMEYLSHSDPIQLGIHSDEGDIYAVLSIIDVMNSLDCNVETICLGKAFSLGLLLLSQGDYRYATSNSYFIFKYPHFLIRNTKLDQGAHEAYINKLNSAITQLYAKKTNNKAMNVELDLLKGLYMDVYEALAYGLIDEII